MTLTKYLDLSERIGELATRRSVDLFIQNELRPLEATEGVDHRFRDLMYSAETRRRYLRR